jgi:lysozyme family protein
MDYFDACFAIITSQAVEGTHSNNPADPGGDTWFGLARASHPDLPWPPTLDQAKIVYRNEYWDRFRCGEMAWPWCLTVFDAAVNQTGHAAKMLQAAVGTAVDGEIGDHTLAAVAIAGPAELERFMEYREAYYRENANWDTFGRGWLDRLTTISAAMQQPPPAQASA